MKYRTKRNLKVITAAILVLVGMAVGGLLLVSLTTATRDDKTPPTSSVPFARLESANMNLEGSWKFETDKGGTFEANVSNNTIQILMKAPTGMSMIYWNGTFENNQSPGAVITSSIIEDGEAVLSQSKTKMFNVGSDTLSFSFTMQGVTKMVDLRRG